jgi:hypothetical protein
MLNVVHQNFETSLVYQKNFTYNALNYNKAILKPQKHEQRRLNNVSSIQIYLAEKDVFKLVTNGGGHGNKGIISQILQLKICLFYQMGHH